MATALLAAVALLGARRLGAQQDPMNRAFDLERRGEYAAAVNAYRGILAAKPTDASAILGLERSLIPLNRASEILAPVRAALAAGAQSPAIFGAALRAYAAAGQTDSLRRVAERWAQVEPTEEGPYREWSAALVMRHDLGGAKAALLEGRERLGRPDALAAELAQLAAGAGDYGTAAHEWTMAVRRLPGYRITAVAQLAQAPERSRGDVLAQLDGDTAARRLAADLRARWGDPLGAYRGLAAALPAERGRQVDMLRQFLDVLRTLNSRDSREAQAMTLEALAERTVGPAAARNRLDAAQAWSDAGTPEVARRVLGVLAADKGTPRDLAAGASVTLVGVLIDEGKTDEAAQRLASLQGTMPADEFANLRRRLLTAWIRAGQLARADSALAGDSTVDGLALAGRVALYRGDLAAAKNRLEAAGPYAGTREESTGRTALLALIQPITAESLPALGAALLLLERGDSAGAADRLDRIAGTLKPAEGGAELRLLAGRIARARGDTATAERRLRAADVAEAPATAPAAELELARLLVAGGRTADASATLEHLILTYPQSALVPQARRELDQLRGGVPRT
jgi:thioredoxin-like negative regulator of GroEL